MKKIKLIPMTAAKPELFEEKVNELMEALEKDPRVEDYTVEVHFSDGSLLGVIEIDMRKEERKKGK